MKYEFLINIVDFFRILSKIYLLFRYNLCGMCLDYESREVYSSILFIKNLFTVTNTVYTILICIQRKAVKRHFEASCIHLHPNPQMPARGLQNYFHCWTIIFSKTYLSLIFCLFFADISSTSGTKRGAPADNDDFEDYDEKLV